MKKTIVVLLILLAMHGIMIAAAVGLKTPIRGERTPVDLDLVSLENVEKGKIMLKFYPECEQDLQDSSKLFAAEGNLSTGIAELDALNQRYGASALRSLLSSKAIDPRFSARHRSWGFHLWYELSLEPNVDIIEVVKAYQDLEGIVDTAEPVYLMTLQEYVDSDQNRWLPNDPRFTEQWHYINTGSNGGTSGADIDLVSAWDFETGHPDVIVAVLDHGVQINHPDLAANIWSGVGWNFVNDSSTLIAGDHATHVAGTIAAVSNNGIGVAGIAGGDGSTSGVSIMSCQVFTSSSQGGFELALIYAADNGAAITQNSYGYQQAGVYNQVMLDSID